MYRLYWFPGSAAMAPHALLEELGAPYELVRVRTDGDDVADDEYARINPQRLVPALAEGDFVVTESAAIVMHLCDRHPEAGLAPAVGSPERALWYQWLLHLSNTLQPAFMAFYHSHRYGEGPAGEAAAKANAEARLEGYFRRIDGELAGRPFLLRSGFSAADLFLFMLTRWGRNLAKPAWDMPGLARHFKATGARPAVRRMLAQQGLEPGPLLA
jgi:glutathione S-transferase